MRILDWNSTLLWGIAGSLRLIVSGSLHSPRAQTVSLQLGYGTNRLCRSSGDRRTNQDRKAAKSRQYGVDAGPSTSYRLLILTMP